MSIQKINYSLANFNLTQKELENRSHLSSSLNSLSSVIVESFAKEYLLNNPNLSAYFIHTNSSRLLRNIKNFIMFIFSEPVNENYINRIHSIGAIHYSIKLEPAKVSYGFTAIKNILDKIYEIDTKLKEHKFFISKLLSFVEYHMNEGYYLEKKRQTKATNNELNLLDTQMELFSKFEIHKESEIIKLQQAMANNSETEIIESKNNINLLAKQFKSVLDTTLNNSLNNTHVALNCAMKAMKKTTELFYQKNYTNDNEKELKEEIKDTINYALLSQFNWVIDSIEIEQKTLSENNIYDLTKLIRYKGESFFIAIILNKDNKNNYILEILTLLLEVLDLHFSVKDRELSLISFADKAESANKAKDMFLANMSHELRTPLNAINGFSQILLAKKETTEASKKFIKKINIAGNHLLELVNTILDFAKLESGKMQFNPSLNDISSILKEVGSLIFPLAQNKNISLKMPKIISLNMYIDSNLFKQVLINLLSNAIKFTPDGGEVNLKINYEASKRVYKFEIKDNGIGLSKDEIEKLFVAFTQIDNSYQKGQKGTGLGLMISKTIIEELHKGKIWVESKKGEGSSFFISMPTPIIESNTYVINDAPKEAKHILIVEDSPYYQNILIEHLKKTHKLTFTDTVNKAKNLILNDTFDFIILDFFLIDGICSEILEFMDDEHINTPTIVISAEDEITIMSSLSGFTNLDGIINKNNINDICASIKGEPNK
jgi:signal transduction histidine kinase